MTFESQTNPLFEHISHILCSNPLQQHLTVEVCDARSNNEVIAFFEIPIKQIYESDAMIMGPQTFALKSLTEPLDQAKIILRLSLNVCLWKRWMEFRLFFLD